MKRGLEIRTVNAHSLHGNSSSKPLNSDLSYPFHSGCVRPKALPRSHRKARQFLAMANRWYDSIGVPNLLVPYKGKVYITKLSHGADPTFAIQRGHLVFDCF